jgi:hypothetical protein
MGTIEWDHFRARLHPQGFPPRQTFPGNESFRDYVNQFDGYASARTVEKCLRLMTDKHIRHLPVVEAIKWWRDLDRDLVKHVISCQQAAIAHLENYIHGGYAAG